MTALKIWIDADPQQPILIFASGFLTEAEIDTPLEAWTEDVIRYATERGWAAAGVYWNCKNIKQLSAEFTSLRTSPLDLVQAWSMAKSNIEDAAQHISQWFMHFQNRDVYLVGHSLGARLFLRVCELMPAQTIKKLLVLAPACKRTDFKFERVTTAIKDKSVCLYSEKDIVLTQMYPIAESPQSLICSSLGLLPKAFGTFAIATQYSISKVRNKAIGASAHQIDKFEFVDASRSFGRDVGHLTYMKLMYSILKRHM